ncbi:uncharacterized protein LOC130815891 isoform X4 [Amaranthus tricolor]|uniref:uncharacterized protein LOC130815891 isoform X4 n=1 Tax=Amaranthus tricolor TaxID=29722 RepID=UPI0025826D8E|nr:uncharacterized protein LOC130815891 isoform X4 [Amaranthus tricolor]
MRSESAIMRNPHLDEVLTIEIPVLRWQLLMNLRDDGEYEEVFEDVREECEKYGGLLSVIILRPIMEGNLIPGGWKG